MDSLQAAVAELRAGHRQAFRQVIQLTQQKLFRVALRAMGDFDEAEDVLQEAYLHALSGIERGKLPSDAGIEGWLYRIVINDALGALRSRRRRRAHAEHAPPPMSMAVEPDVRLALDELNDWLQDLPPDQRIALVLKELEGLSTAEVAYMVNTSEGAVEQRLVRARAALRRRRDDG